MSLYMHTSLTQHFFSRSERVSGLRPFLSELPCGTWIMTSL